MPIIAVATETFYAERANGTSVVQFYTPAGYFADTHGYLKLGLFSAPRSEYPAAARRAAAALLAQRVYAWRRHTYWREDYLLALLKKDVT